MHMRHDGIKDAKAIDLTRCEAESDRQRGTSRRTQALLAAAGMDRPSRKWFVITVRNGEDRSVAEELGRSGVGYWLPVVMVMPPRRGGMAKKERTPVERLALKGYIFVRVAATVDAWSGLSTIRGVAGMLGCNGRPMPLDDRVVELFRLYFADDPQAKATVTNAVRQGDQVVVRDGPLLSLHGTVKTLDEARGRVRVLLTLFGHVHPVEMDIAQIAKL